jgi:nicotinic acid mononucleotide adenylyltransferase
MQNKTKHKVFFGLSANPLHDGHKLIRQKMIEKYGNCTYILTTENADKGTVDREEIYRRVEQFNHDDYLLLNKSTIIDMAVYIRHVIMKPYKFHSGFPGTKMVFAIGVDTLERIVHPKYYRCEVGKIIRHLTEIGVVFEVFSRNGLTLNDVCSKMGENKRQLEFISVDAGNSLNISSTEIRNA